MVEKIGLLTVRQHCACERTDLLLPRAMNDKKIANMRARIERCRRLASHIIDERTAKILRDMADEGEADLRRLESERDVAKDDYPGRV